MSDRLKSQEIEEHEAAGEIFRGDTALMRGFASVEGVCCDSSSVEVKVVRYCPRKAGVAQRPGSAGYVRMRVNNDDGDDPPLAIAAVDVHDLVAIARRVLLDSALDLLE